MSREYMVLIVDEPSENQDVEGCHAQVFMRFTEHPGEDFLQRLAQDHPGRRVYCLLGASTWSTSPYATLSARSSTQSEP